MNLTVKKHRQLWNSMVYKVSCDGDENNNEQHYQFIKSEQFEPYFYFPNVSVNNLMVIRMPVLDYEDEIELTKLNLYLQIDCTHSLENKAYLNFLTGFQEGCWCEHTNSTEYTLKLKLTDYSQLFRNHKDVTYELQDHGQILAPETSVKGLIICRAWDMVSRKWYWCLSQLIL